MDEEVFGEGICWLNPTEFIEMTWKEDLVYILDRDTLKVKRQFSMGEYWPSVSQGWGITLDPESNLLYVSDGSMRLTVVDANTLREVGTLNVRNKSG